jgi:deazaflavin-dependent oxidoreductase (nitroreductase family)
LPQPLAQPAPGLPGTAARREPPTLVQRAGDEQLGPAWSGISSARPRVRRTGLALTCFEHILDRGAILQCRGAVRVIPAHPPTDTEAELLVQRSGARVFDTDFETDRSTVCRLLRECFAHEPPCQAGPPISGLYRNRQDAGVHGLDIGYHDHGTDHRPADARYQQPGRPLAETLVENRRPFPTTVTVGARKRARIERDELVEVCVPRRCNTHLVRAHVCDVTSTRYSVGMTFPSNEYNQQLVESFRANGGVAPNGSPLLLLTTTGAKSGLTRVNPLAFTRDGERYVVIASKGGYPTNPDWYHNLVAHPEVTVEVDRKRFAARAIVAQGDERQRLFDAQAAIMPNFADYQTKTARPIPVVVLEPLQNGL